MTDLTAQDQELIAGLLDMSDDPQTTVAQAAARIEELARDRDLARDKANAAIFEAAELSALMKDRDARIAELEAALRLLLPPSCGVCGGPLIGLKAIYEDGTDEDTRRHKGWIDHAEVNRARAVLPMHHQQEPDMESIQLTDKQSAAVAKAPRVALADIEAAIKARYDITADKAVGDVPACDELSVLSICILVMRNGFVVVGKSAPASADNFNAELGRKFAYEDAIRQLWPLMGYALRERIYHGW